MELYNSLIQETRALTDKFSAKVWDYDPKAAWPANSASELVLQKDAAFELGASGKGSANYVLFTSSEELVSRDQIILIGCGETTNSLLPFVPLPHTLPPVSG